QLRELYALKIPPAKRTPDFDADCNRFVIESRREGRYNLVVYSWLKKVVFVLNEDDFSFVRTSRNLYKITREEQQTLASATVGVVGLSVGQSVAVTLAMERSFGTIKLADFDALDLSNLNRLRAGIVDIDLPKVVLVAREIAEIDPYLKVMLYPEGLTNENMNEFVDDLDVLVDECDSLQMKIAMRQRARSKGIPVIMDTSDRGMIDIERFDLDKEKPLFHGLVNEKELHDIDDSNRLNVLFKLVGGGSISPELAVSFFELNQSIGTWPQLASAVALGGGLATSAVRQILLKKNVDSGRWYFDPESSWSQSPKESNKPTVPSFLTGKTPLAVDMELAFFGLLHIDTTDTHWKLSFNSSVEHSVELFLEAAIQKWFSLSNNSFSLINKGSRGVFEVVKTEVEISDSELILSAVSEQNLFSCVSQMNRTFMDECYRGSHHHVTAVYSALQGNERSVWFGVPPPFLLLLSRPDVAKRTYALPEQNTISAMLAGIIRGMRFYNLHLKGNNNIESIGAALGSVLYKNQSARLIIKDMQALSTHLKEAAQSELKLDNELPGLGLNVSHDIT
ncbi:MAG: ThiF family adenylyltransferase, partial [Cryomorphaceae bacterium]|nr:ThiF family adenylyltransferase [Cryomorphaceae bacterium]